jgi:hypothetical protein
MGNVRTWYFQCWDVGVTRPVVDGVANKSSVIRLRVVCVGVGWKGL